MSRAAHSPSQHSRSALIFWRAAPIIHRLWTICVAGSLSRRKSITPGHPPLSNNNTYFLSEFTLVLSCILFVLCCWLLPAVNLLLVVETFLFSYRVGLDLIDKNCKCAGSWLLAGAYILSHLPTLKYPFWVGSQLKLVREWMRARNFGWFWPSSSVPFSIIPLAVLLIYNHSDSAWYLLTLTRRLLVS